MSKKVSGISEPTVAHIVASVEAGNYLDAAARAAGIGVRTAYGWQERGRRDIAAGNADTPHARFALAVDEARGKAEVRTLGVIQHAALEHWQAAAWWLERSQPKKWGQRRFTEVELRGRIEELIEAVRPRMSAPAYAELIQALVDIDGVSPSTEEPGGSRDAEAEQRIEH